MIYELLRNHIEKKISLTDEEFAVVSSFFTERKLKRRQFLLQQGDICHHESFVASGCLKLYHTDSHGIDHILRFSIEGWWAGDLDSFLNKKPSSFNIEAIEPVTSLVITKPHLAELYGKVPKLETFFRILNENALISNSKRIIENLSLPAKERYQIFLDTYPQFSQRFPLKDIASF